MEFWDIYDQYYVKVRRFILGLVRDESMADDLIQETFLRVQQNSAALRDPSKLSSWIFRIAHNLCLDHFRQMKPTVPEEAIDEELTSDTRGLSTEEEVGQHEMGKCVQAQVSLLPVPLRTVLLLSDIMEFSQQEIADTLGITVENVKVRLHRARKRLKTILEEKCAFGTDERNVLVCTPKE